MRHPEGDGGEVGIRVGAGAVRPGAREMEGHAAGFARKGFDSNFGKTAPEGDVAIDEAEDPEDAVVGPEGQDGDDVGHLRERAYLGVHVDSEERGGGEKLMEMEEGLIEGVSDC
jgi:hypothetical protein